MKNTTQEGLNQREIPYSEKQIKLFLFFLFAVWVIYLYLMPERKYDEQFSKTIEMAVREEEQGQERLTPNLESFCYENRWSKRKCREVSELHANLHKYEEYLNLMSIDKD